MINTQYLRLLKKYKELGGEKKLEKVPKDQNLLDIRGALIKIEKAITTEEIIATIYKLNEKIETKDDTNT